MNILFHKLFKNTLKILNKYLKLPAIFPFNIFNSTSTNLLPAHANFILEISHKFPHSAQPTNKHPICICNCNCNCICICICCLLLYLRICNCIYIFCLWARILRHSSAIFELFASHCRRLWRQPFGHNCGRTSSSPALHTPSPLSLSLPLSHWQSIVRMACA